MVTFSGSRPEPQDRYQVMTSAAAWTQLAAPEPSRMTRFVPGGGPRKGLVLLVDGVPSSRRSAVWSRVIAEAELRGYRVAARASAPDSGPDDGAIEVLGIFGQSANDEADLEAVWADALTVEWGES